MSSMIQVQFHHNEPETILSKPKKRWQSAFVKVCCARAFLLKPTPGTINPFSSQLSGSVVHVHPDDGSFNIDQPCLSELVKDKKLDQLKDLGGVEGIASALQTDTKKGILGDGEDLANRREAFGDNTSKKPTTYGFFRFVWEALNDVTIFILLGWTALWLAFGITKYGLKEGGSNGVTLVSVFTVIAVSAIVNIGQLCKVSNKIEIEAVRSGVPRQISMYEIVVGDVVFLKMGDQVPADGLFLGGHSLQVDESSMTGQSDHVEVSTTNPFLFYGTKVYCGHAHMLVTSVGMNTTWDKTMSSISDDNDEETPLQARLHTLTEAIRRVGLAVAFLVLVVLLVRYFTGNTTDEHGVGEFNGRKTKADIIDAMDNIITAAVTIILVAIPEGLPLDVTLITLRNTVDGSNVWELSGSKIKNNGIASAMINLFTAGMMIFNVVIPGGLSLVVMLTLAYLLERMMTNQGIVRKLSPCETMGSATIICTDKTGTLTMNQMKVTKFWLGQQVMERSSIPPFVLELLQQGVAFNTTGSVCDSVSGSELEFSGSPTEKAILSWAVLDLGMDMEEMKQGCEIVDVEHFNSEAKRSGVLIRKKGDDTTSHVHWKGAAEMVLDMCSSYYDASGVLKDLSDGERDVFQKIIEGMAASSLRCIAFAHAQVIEEEKIKDKNITLLGLVGLTDPCRPGVKKAVQDCQHAGVNIKMITGDNIFTARAIATECGILKPDRDMSGAVVEGVEFRNYTEAERMDKVDKLCVMARSSPLDKLLMVRCLKQKGHVVAVTGDATNDAPALKEADIGLSMGIQVAKQSSDIVISDDNFGSVVVILKWGRCVYNNIQKLIQIQLTVNVTALTINFVVAISAGEVPITALELLWVNLIMGTLGALALATEQPTKELMQKPPVARTESLITNIMWRNLLAQAFCQITILLTLRFRGESIFNVNAGVRNTLIFNTFVLCQVFNTFNTTKMERKNVWKGIHKNRLFLGIVGVTIALQVVVVEFVNRLERLNWGQWGACIGMAALSWPIGWIVKCIPVPSSAT